MDGNRSSQTSQSQATTMDKSKAVSNNAPVKTFSRRRLKLAPSNGISLARILRQFTGNSGQETKAILVAGDATQLSTPHHNSACETNTTCLSSPESVANSVCPSASKGVVSTMSSRALEGVVNSMCPSGSEDVLSTMCSSAMKSVANTPCQSICLARGGVGTHQSGSLQCEAKRRYAEGNPKRVSHTRYLGEQSRSFKNKESNSPEEHLNCLKEFIRKKEREVELITQQLQSLEKQKAKTISFSSASVKRSSIHIHGDNRKVSKVSQFKAAGIAKKIRLHRESSKTTLQKPVHSLEAFIPDVKAGIFLELLGLEVVVDSLVQHNEDPNIQSWIELTSD